MRKIIKIIAYILAYIITTIIITLDEFVGILTFTFLSMFLISKWFSKIIDNTNKQDMKINLKYARKGNERYYNLFTWLGEQRNSDKIIYEIIGDKIDKPTTLENLHDLKQLLISKIGDNITDYYLIRNLLEESSNENFSSFLKSVFSKIAFGTFLVTLVSALLNNNKEIKDYLVEYNLIIYFCLGILILFALLNFLIIIYNTSSKTKKRSRVIIMILNEIIREKESHN